MRKFSSILALLLAVAMLFSCVACVNEGEDDTEAPGTTDATESSTVAPDDGADEIVVESFPEGDYIWKSAVSTMAANWNTHTYQTTTDSMPLDYTSVGLYSFIYNDGLHPKEGVDPYAGYVIVPEMAESEPVDVTEQVKAEHPEFGIPETATSGYAYTIDLNKNATWDDGTPINAETYVESFKRLLDGRFQNYRAADYIGQTLSIVGTGDYFNSGRTVKEDNGATGLYAAIADLVKAEDGSYTTPDGSMVYIGVNYSLDWLGGNTLKQYVDAYGDAYFGTERWEELVALIDANGLVPLNDDNLALLVSVIATNPAWGETEANAPSYFVYEKTYPEFAWEGVGLLASGEYQITVVLDKSLAGFDLLYNISVLTNPLVKIDLYDACLKEEVGAGGESVWSSTYGTSLETSVSYGPYKISEFQPDKLMHFVRNENWYGYTDGKHIYQDPDDGLYYPMYQTTEIDVQVVAESSTMKLMFFAGELMGYGLHAADYATLRNSDYCYASPGSTIFFLILNGHQQAISEREAAADFDRTKYDLQMLSNTAFHQALGLTYDKDDFAATISPARSGALGIIGDAYIYNPDTGARYRDTDQAKQVLCDFYGVDTSAFANLDDAVASITGYDPEQAKVYFAQAFAEGIEAQYITDADNDGISDQIIRIEYAMGSEVNDFMTQTIKYLNDHVAEVAQGTPFEGKIEFYMSANYGGEWFEKIRQGQSDTVLGGWSGSLLDPFGLTDLYTNPEKQYDAAWYDATKVELTINVPVNGENKDVTLTLKQWSDALNGTAVTVDGVEYNYGSGQVDTEIRLDILAACEGKILESYNYLPMLLDGSMALLSQQVYYVIEEYNPILGRGGITYTRYNYNEADWAAYVADQGGELKY